MVATKKSTEETEIFKAEKVSGSTDIPDTLVVSAPKKLTAPTKTLPLLPTVKPSIKSTIVDEKEQERIDANKKETLKDAKNVVQRDDLLTTLEQQSKLQKSQKEAQLKKQQEDADKAYLAGWEQYKNKTKQMKTEDAEALRRLLKDLSPGDVQNKALAKEIEMDRLDNVKLLIDGGADDTGFEKTALTFALEKGDTKFAKTLINKGADLSRVFDYAIDDDKAENKFISQLKSLGVDEKEVDLARAESGLRQAINEDDEGVKNSKVMSILNSLGKDNQAEKKLDDFNDGPELFIKKIKGEVLQDMYEKEIAKGDQADNDKAIRILRQVASIAGYKKDNEELRSIVVNNLNQKKDDEKTTKSKTTGPNVLAKPIQQALPILQRTSSTPISTKTVDQVPKKQDSEKPLLQKIASIPTSISNPSLLKINNFFEYNQSQKQEPEEPLLQKMASMPKVSVLGPDQESTPVKKPQPSKRSNILENDPLPKEVKNAWGEQPMTKATSLPKKQIEQVKNYR